MPHHSNSNRKLVWSHTHRYRINNHFCPLFTPSSNRNNRHPLRQQWSRVNRRLNQIRLSRLRHHRDSRQCLHKLPPLRRKQRYYSEPLQFQCHHWLWPPQFPQNPLHQLEKWKNLIARSFHASRSLPSSPPLPSHQRCRSRIHSRRIPITNSIRSTLVIMWIWNSCNLAACPPNAQSLTSAQLSVLIL